jgi:hypothetical protein
MSLRTTLRYETSSLLSVTNHRSLFIMSLALVPIYQESMTLKPVILSVPKECIVG